MTDVFGFFDIAGYVQYTYIIGKYIIRLQPLRNTKQDRKARKDQFYVFRQCTYIVFITKQVLLTQETQTKSVNIQSSTRKRNINLSLELI